jgi:hypothetical protein
VKSKMALQSNLESGLEQQQPVGSHSPFNPVGLQVGAKEMTTLRASGPMPPGYHDAVMIRPPGDGSPNEPPSPALPGQPPPEQVRPDPKTDPHYSPEEQQSFRNWDAVKQLFPELNDSNDTTDVRRAAWDWLNRHTCALSPSPEADAKEEAEMDRYSPGMSARVKALLETVKGNCPSPTS